MNDQKIRAMLAEKFSFWEKLTQPQKELLLSGVRQVGYARGEHVHSPANECVGVLLVKEGELRTYLLSEGGREVTLFRLGEGEVCVLSATCLLSNITFDVFIDARQDTEVLLINPTVFAQLQSENLHVENFALRVAADRFSDVVWAMEQILFMSFDARLAAFLLDEAGKNGSDRLSITHDEIAKNLGSAREVVSRMLKYFEREGIVSLYRGGVELRDKAALQALTQKA